MIALGLVIGGILIGVWLLAVDQPERNPFHTLRVYRLLIVGLLGIVVLLAYKSFVWNRDLRQLILTTCR